MKETVRRIVKRHPEVIGHEIKNQKLYLGYVGSSVSGTTLMDFVNNFGYKIGIRFLPIGEFNAKFQNS